MHFVLPNQDPPMKKLLLLTAAVALLTTSVVKAQTWPTRNVRCIVPFAAGATPDSIGSNGGIFAMSGRHIQPHLGGGDGEGREYLIPLFREETDTLPGRSPQPQALPPRAQGRRP